MDKNVLYRLEEAKDLIIEAKYIIEDVAENTNILGLTKMEYLEATIELIAILAKIPSNDLKDLPVEAVYKFLWRDYKKSQEEICELRKDIKQLMKTKGIEDDKQALVLKLQRTERVIESLTQKIEIKNEKIKHLRGKCSDLKKKLNSIVEGEDE